jgi:hypothetical protein
LPDGDDVADVEGDEEAGSRMVLLNLDDGELELLEIPSLTEPRSDEVDAEASWYD